MIHSFFRKNKWVIWFVCGLLVVSLLGIQTPELAVATPTTDSSVSQISPKIPLTNPMEQGANLYHAGKFTEAVEAFRQAVETYQARGEYLQQATALSNLSLAYQQLGLLAQAQEAITKSLDLLPSDESVPTLKVSAQVWQILGHLQFLQGKLPTALESWQQASNFYSQIGDETGKIKALINQAQALQALGFDRRAFALLTEAEETLMAQPDTVTKIVGLGSLGKVLQSVGNLEQSRSVLEQSLTIAQTLSNAHYLSVTLFNLGNVARAQKQPEIALNYYQQAISASAQPEDQIQALLNQISLLIEEREFQQALTLTSSIELLLKDLPSSRHSVQARINFAKHLMRIQEDANANLAIANHLAIAIEQASSLRDLRAKSYGLGTLGQLYENNQQWQSAQELSQQALALSVQINASDLSYLWEWQLGRLLVQQEDEEGAIRAYESALELLKLIRSDLVAANSEVRFSFRETIEPVYRELVSLLLTPQGNKTNSEKLERARKVIESLQLAELDNFFRSACLNATPVLIEEVDSQVAVIYPIILPDRLEVIFRLPQQPLGHYSVKRTSEEVEKTVKKLRSTITHRLRYEYLSSAQLLYDWLIRPIQEDLADLEIEGLVFILDDALRNVPMAVLHDREQYLIQKYALAVTPGLELLKSESLSRGQLQVLAAGLSEARQNFSALPGVEVELEQIQTQVSAQVLLNQQFTETEIQNAVNTVSSPVVHLATHGQFSSNAEDTFILTWDGKINVYELNTLLKNTQLGRELPIELLVLSACQTAEGDKRAALGIAGLALRAGARSTIASLWTVDDAATSALMVRLYQELANPEITKSEALRRAQISILQDPQFREHPYFWAPFILVGNWL